MGPTRIIDHKREKNTLLSVTLAIPSGSPFHSLIVFGKKEFEKLAARMPGARIKCFKHSKL